MTNTRRVLLGAVLTAAIGTGIHQTRDASHLRGELRELQQRQESLANQIQQLERERSDMTNRIEILAAENRSLKLNGNEMPKLRGEITRLRSDALDVEQKNEDLRTELAARPQLAVIQSCRANLQRIDQAIAVYALENRQPSGTEVTLQNILGYLGAKQLPECPVGGNYSLGRVGEHPSCSVEGPGHSLGQIGPPK